MLIPCLGKGHSSLAGSPCDLPSPGGFQLFLAFLGDKRSLTSAGSGESASLPAIRPKVGVTQGLLSPGKNRASGAVGSWPQEQAQWVRRTQRELP